MQSEGKEEWRWSLQRRGTGEGWNDTDEDCILLKSGVGGKGGVYTLLNNLPFPLIKS